MDCNLCDEIKPSHPQAGFGHCFIKATGRNLDKDLAIKKKKKRKGLNAGAVSGQTKSLDGTALALHNPSSVA